MLLTIVLTVLGLERRVALFEQLRNDRALAAALKDAASAVKAQRYGLAALELERLMRVVTQPDNVQTIAENLGNDSRRRLYRSLILRFVPFVGWTYFDTLLLATVYYNRDTTAPVLRLGQRLLFPAPQTDETTRPLRAIRGRAATGWLRTARPESSAGRHR